MTLSLEKFFWISLFSDLHIVKIKDFLLFIYKNYEVYRVPATGTQSPRIWYRQSLWLADTWHAYWAAGSEPSKRKQSKWRRRSSD